MIRYLEKAGKYCTGCTACSAACPAEAITMKENALGFKEACIDDKICIHCHLCTKICPVLSEHSRQSEAKPMCYAAQADDPLRKKSSSGGMFSLMAEETLKQDGIVYGAAMDDSLNVFHTGICKTEELDKLRKSKYVQSDLRCVFKEALEALKTDKQVLFTGTPCQIAGLKAFLGKDYDNLITVDILCHGVPSNKMLKDYIRETTDDKVTGIDFRNAGYGWKENPRNLVLHYKDKIEQNIYYADSPYEQGFHQDLTLRDCCYDCKFAELPRQADISIGDFWGIGDRKKELDDDIGTSVVFINNQKGKDFFNKITSRLKLLESTPVEWLTDNRIHAVRKGHPYREYFKYLYSRTGCFGKAVNNALEYKIKTGIVGPWMNTNIGGALTYYGLYAALEQMGYSPVMISQPRGVEWDPAPEVCGFKKIPYPAHAIAPIKTGYVQQREYNDGCDTYIVGSDQLFTGEMMRILDGYADLEWASAKSKKIAYAASFAYDHYKGSPTQKEKLKYFLNRFDAFSVREKSGVALAESEFGIHAELVIDPVFLCSKDTWLNLADSAGLHFSDDKYIFGYILDPDKEKESIINAADTAYGSSCRVVTQRWTSEDTLKQIWDIPTVSNISNEEFLAQLLHSECVITDSFHGVCFSLIFHKPFWVLINKERGASRFRSLLSALGLEDRIITSKENIEPDRLIDYDRVEKILSRMKENSLSWLKNAIESNHEGHRFTDYDAACSYFDTNRKIIEKQRKFERDSLNGRIDWLIGDVEKRDADANGRIDWLIGDVEKRDADANGRIDWLIGDVERRDADANSRIDRLISDVEKREKDLKKSIKDLKKETGSLKKEINAIKKSRSYKLGRALTWLPRKIRKLFKKQK